MTRTVLILTPDQIALMQEALEIAEAQLAEDHEQIPDMREGREALAKSERMGALADMLFSYPRAMVDLLDD